MQVQQHKSITARWVIVGSSVVLGLVFVLGVSGDPTSAAGPRYPLGSPEAAEAQAFDPFNPEDALDPSEPAPWDEEELFRLFGSRAVTQGTWSPPPGPPTSIFVPWRPPAASPIR